MNIGLVANWSSCVGRTGHRDDAEPFAVGIASHRGGIEPAKAGDLGSTPSQSTTLVREALDRFLNGGGK